VKKLLYSLSCFFLFVLFVASCTKIRTTELGGDLIPAVDNVSVFDTTLEVISELYPLADSTRISFRADHAIGIMEDPSFGKTTGEAYVQMLYGSVGAYPFGPSRDSLVGIDSLVMSLNFTSLYGDSNSIQSFKVYEVSPSSDFRDSSIGYLINHPSFDVTDLVGEKNNVSFKTLDDSIQYMKIKDTIKTAKELRISLSNSLGWKLMNLDTAIYKSDSAFKANFKGFAIKTDEGSAIKRAMAYFNLLNAGTHLSFYYRRIKNGVADTTSTEFVFRTSANANVIKRDPGSTPYATKILNGTGNQEELYLQSTPGSYALLRIPGLAGLNNRLVYKALLTTDRIAGLEDNVFVQPSKLFLDAFDSANHQYLTIPNQFVPDVANSTYDANTFGGVLKNNNYSFDLARYVQGIVTKKEKSYLLRLYAPYRTSPFIFNSGGVAFPITVNAPVTSGRVIVAGGANPVKKMRLYIIYSKI
jgi:Domain of unknown function (DUF4270)